MITLHDREELRAFFDRDPWLHLYEIGDLDPFFWPRTTWYGLREGSDLKAVALLYTGLSIPTLLLLAPPGDRAACALLRQLPAVLPKRFYAHLGMGLAETLRREWLLSARGRFQKMALRDRSALPAAEDGFDVHLLGPDDAPELGAFYSRSYPENTFDPAVLQTGGYVGIRVRGELAAAGGVNVLSEEQGVAALGNVAVDPAHRGQGLGRAVTAALCRHLKVERIGLNVRMDNLAAIRCYQALGFAAVADYEEWKAAG